MATGHGEAWKPTAGQVEDGGLCAFTLFVHASRGTDGLQRPLTKIDGLTQHMRVAGHMSDLPFGGRCAAAESHSRRRRNGGSAEGTPADVSRHSSMSTQARAPSVADSYSYAEDGGADWLQGIPIAEPLPS